jgi:hypothetical protein
MPGRREGYGVVCVAVPAPVDVPAGLGCVVVPGVEVVRPAAPGVVAVGVVAVGTVPVAAGGVTGGATTGGTTTGGTTAGGATGAADVIAAGVVVTLSSLVSRTNANAKSAPATSMTAPIATVGSCQFGVGARRVRAGAPHSTHQS